LVVTFSCPSQIHRCSGFARPWKPPLLTYALRFVLPICVSFLPPPYFASDSATRPFSEWIFAFPLSPLRCWKQHFTNMPATLPCFLIQPPLPFALQQGPREPSRAKPSPLACKIFFPFPTLKIDGSFFMSRSVRLLFSDYSGGLPVERCQDHPFSLVDFSCNRGGKGASLFCEGLGPRPSFFRF